MATAAVRFQIRGVVQGVGFRPFIYRIAVKSGVKGYVANTPGSVVVHVEGEREAIDRFQARFRQEMPPAARVTRVARKSLPPAGYTEFTIDRSERRGVALSTIPPDIALCPACRSELSDPSDRRHHYPFINCTNCGPRFTIVSRLPYDREHTSMAAFPLCTRCRTEYENPLDRRFHAEPNACPACGPSLSLTSPEGETVPADDPIGYAADRLREGKIVAVRGLGGFHLAADATNDDAVTRLRERKRREEKPFAVMVADTESARRLARVSASEAGLLRSPSSPVVLLGKRKRSGLAPSVAPGLAQVGLFLPYTPLHTMLLARAGRPLVMTSGNVTDEPIAAGNGEALQRLGGIADLFLLHNREIVQRTDDSVVRVLSGRACPIRRARGYVPAPVLLASRFPEVAGLGGELKGAFCFIKENVAYLSQHLGDLDHPLVRDFYADTFDFFRRFLEADLAAVCRDLHPGYFTTNFAEKVPARRHLALQHHKAHLYALLAETGFSGKAVGVSFDGTGYGEDGTIWGGEFFRIDGMEMERAASLAPFPLQGGDSSIKEPWKTALSLLHETLGRREAEETALRLLDGISPETIRRVGEALEKKVNVVRTSSAGRLFDGVSALSGVCRRASYEGQAAMLLEGAVPRGKKGAPYAFQVTDDGKRLTVHWKDAIGEIVADVAKGVPAQAIAGRFHDTVAAMILSAAGTLAEEQGTDRVLLSGGVFQNVLLVRKLLAGLRERNLKAVIHRQVPPNDGGIALGQAYYAAHMVAGG